MKLWLAVALLVGLSLTAFGAQSSSETQRKAEQGNAGAPENLGWIYELGDGGPKDPVRAHAWSNIAGANGNEDAKKNLVSIEKEMCSEQKAEETTRARELFERLAKE